MISKILLFALLNQWIYDPVKFADDKLFKPLYVGKRFGIVKDFNDDCVIVHKGTTDIDDAFHDFMSQISDECTKDGYSKYFYDSFMEYSHELEREMKNLIDDKSCFSFLATGHSLGGSAAIINAEHPYVKHIATYGSPKTCCNDRNSINGPGDLHRVINGDIDNNTNDPIPALPKHKNFNNCGDKIVNVEKVTRVKYESSPRFAVEPINGKIRNIKKHHIQSYVEKLLE